MKFNYPIEETVKTRYSARAYTDKPNSTEIKEKISAYIRTLSNPFSVKVTYHMLELENAANAEKLGTYGVINGSVDYVGATVAKGDLALEGLGYEFENLILYITSLGLGTCWLGGTFERGAFSKAMTVKEDELFPIITPFGYSASKKRLVDAVTKRIADPNQRKPWSELFFNKSFTTPLSEVDAGAFALPLEMVRLAPSASNKQPWRIVQDGSVYHFYEAKEPGYSDRFEYDIQQIDIGIAACHFNFSAAEKNLLGDFKKLPEPISDVPENTLYAFSWISK